MQPTSATGADTLLTEGTAVLTPQGPGTVFTVHVDARSAVALVRGETGLRPWAFRDLTYPDGSPIVTTLRDGPQQAHGVDHREQLIQAHSSDGIDVGQGFRLAELNTSAGHGWIIDATGARVAFVRARYGEDNQRRWWLQRLDGGAPFDSAHPEQLRSDQPHAAVRAARRAGWYLRGDATEPIPPHRAARQVTLTLPRVRELRSLPPATAPFTGQAVSAPEWHDRWRRYRLTVEQMTALADAASRAVATEPHDTAQQRRRGRVLTAAAEQLRFQAFDTARHCATIATPGDADPYDAPYVARSAEQPITALDTCDVEAESHAPSSHGISQSEDQVPQPQPPAPSLEARNAGTTEQDCLTYFLGSANPAWLARAGVPLFVSDARLRHRKKLPRAIAPWALDSGGFSQLQQHGFWTFTAAEYVQRVRRYRDEIGGLLWAAPMDHMTEDAIIEGGVYKGQKFVGTRQFLDPDHSMTLEELRALHQRLTVENLVELRALAPDDLHFIPVLQGQTTDDYVRCIQLYREAGVDLTREPLVGLGSVCRRQNSDEIFRIVCAVRAQGVKYLHGFGVKVLGLRRYGDLLSSADSSAWSFGYRYEDGPVCGEVHPRGAKNCANCLPAALAWRKRVLASCNAAPRSLALWDVAVA
ncbi:deazapurine DNA modification protein DpdA family protein [Nocardia asiatica]|uniref:deazapurine DNA modification protein DpdA family protein n=1 Tax=Nocardia asiatica TaxID=209252 RepID=UPI001C3F3F8C|nr:hypothetical protein [Nocardia asiatica]